MPGSAASLVTAGAFPSGSSASADVGLEFFGNRCPLRGEQSQRLQQQQVSSGRLENPAPSTFLDDFQVVRVRIIGKYGQFESVLSFRLRMAGAAGAPGLARDRQHIADEGRGGVRGRRRQRPSRGSESRVLRSARRSSRCPENRRPRRRRGRSERSAGAGGPAHRIGDVHLKPVLRCRRDQEAAPRASADRSRAEGSALRGTEFAGAGVPGLLGWAWVCRQRLWTSGERPNPGAYRRWGGAAVNAGVGGEIAATCFPSLSQTRTLPSWEAAAIRCHRVNWRRAEAAAGVVPTCCFIPGRGNFAPRCQDLRFVYRKMAQESVAATMDDPSRARRPR